MWYKFLPEELPLGADPTLGPGIFWHGSHGSAETTHTQRHFKINFKMFSIIHPVQKKQSKEEKKRLKTDTFFHHWHLSA